MPTNNVKVLRPMRAMHDKLSKEFSTMATFFSFIYSVRFGFLEGEQEIIHICHILWTAGKRAACIQQCFITPTIRDAHKFFSHTKSSSKYQFPSARFGGQWPHADTSYRHLLQPSIGVKAACPGTGSSIAHACARMRPTRPLPMITRSHFVGYESKPR